MIRSLAAGLALFCAWGSISCGSSDPERPPPFLSLGGAVQIGPVPQSDSCEKPPEADTTGICGNDTVRLFEQKPTLYFVLDLSGSMADSVKNGEDRKVDAAKKALINVATEVGHRVRYGLTVFPGEDKDFDLDDPDAIEQVFGCAAGDEVFSVQEGDPIECLNRKPNGAVLRKFKQTVEALTVRGGTPLSPTLEKLIPSLAGQEGQTAVVLLTDGSPNCNPEAVCKIEDCEANRGGYSLSLLSGENILCDDEFNCCDPAVVGDILDSPAARCVDIDASERALEFLRNAGVDTYVIGVLGGRAFDEDMNRLAIAGGTARTGARAYYDVESLDELSDTVRLIGSELALSCTIELKDRPPQANKLNVYLDGEILPWGDKDGWTLLEQTVSLNGPACDRVRSGDVTEIQLLSGCQTVIR